MDTSILNPILKKESILKTASASELRQAPHDVAQRYEAYAATHIPLGDTREQLLKLRRTVVENKRCAVGTIVGPYGYGKTSTAVHLWHELGHEKILAVPPFLWANLADLIDGTFAWIAYCFEQGPKSYLGDLDSLYQRFNQRATDDLIVKLGRELFDDLREKGQLILEINPKDVIGFFTGASEICERAGYGGLVIFTDELQVTLAGYNPSRDQFFNDLFALVKDIQDLPGHWAWIISLDDDTEGVITRMRNDIYQRMQKSALFFRVRDIYNRQAYPKELWHAYGRQFNFDGSAVIQPATLVALGQIAAREDLGAGPRMVTVALALGVKHFQEVERAYTPIDLINDFLRGQVIFDKQGKLAIEVKRALEYSLIKTEERFQRLIKLLAAFPSGCPEEIIGEYLLQEAYNKLPALARRDLLVSVANGVTLLGLADANIKEEPIQQRLVRDFSGGYDNGRHYAEFAAEAWLQSVLVGDIFAQGWKEGRREKSQDGAIRIPLAGQFDNTYPNRTVDMIVGAVKTSPAPIWKKHDADSHLEIRFELNYGLEPGEPCRLQVASEQSNIAIFQLNIRAVNEEIVKRTLPHYLFDYYRPDQWSAMLALSLLHHLGQNQSEAPKEQQNIDLLARQLRQFALTMLLGDTILVTPPEFSSAMVGAERIKELVRRMCQKLFPHYRTLITSTAAAGRGKDLWKETLGYYVHALDALKDQVSIARGRQLWEPTKDEAAEAFAIPGKRLTILDNTLEVLKDVIERVEYAGRTADSRVKLKFKMHPIEEDWLAQLDASEETMRVKDQTVPCLPYEVLFRDAMAKGYTLEECGQILQLLVKRQFVIFDQQRNRVARSFEMLDEIREDTTKKLDSLASLIERLAKTFPDFERDRYLLQRWSTQLAAATDRDQIEGLRQEVRRAEQHVVNFAQSRANSLNLQAGELLSEMHKTWNQGVPRWLADEFPPGPLQTYLESQRRDKAAEYRGFVEQVRELREAGQKMIDDIQTESKVEFACLLFDARQDLQVRFKKLTTLIEGIQIRREFFEAWRKIEEDGKELAHEADRARTVFGNTAAAEAVAKLWKKAQLQAEENPSAFFARHGEMAREIAEQRREISAWIEGRRLEFERTIARYREVLGMAGITSELRVPFDRDLPKESDAVLRRDVRQVVIAAVDRLVTVLKQGQQSVRYNQRISRQNLSDLDQQSAAQIAEAVKILGAITDVALATPEALRDTVLAPLAQAVAKQQGLSESIRQRTQTSAADGKELELLEQITAQPGQEIDLRALILQAIDNEQEVSIDDLIAVATRLFQKNLIDFRIMATRRDR